jgi:hypothetical protein
MSGSMGLDKRAHVSEYRRRSCRGGFGKNTSGERSFSLGCGVTESRGAAESTLRSHARARGRTAQIAGETQSSGAAGFGG